MRRENSSLKATVCFSFELFRSKWKIINERSCIYRLCFHPSLSLKTRFFHQKVVKSNISQNITLWGARTILGGRTSAFLCTRGCMENTLGRTSVLLCTQVRISSFFTRNRLFLRPLSVFFRTTCLGLMPLSFFLRTYYFFLLDIKLINNLHIPLPSPNHAILYMY